MCSEFFRPTFFQVLPPSIGLVDAVAVADAALAVVLAGADPDDVRVLRIERDAADRVRAFAVEDRRPGGAGVGGLPDAARGHRDVPGGRLRGSTAMSPMRPEVRAGPMPRSSRPAKVPAVRPPFFSSAFASLSAFLPFLSALSAFWPLGRRRRRPRAAGRARIQGFVSLDILQNRFKELPERPERPVCGRTATERSLLRLRPGRGGWTLR